MNAIAFRGFPNSWRSRWLMDCSGMIMILQVFTHVSNNAEKFRKSGIEDLTSTVYVYIYTAYIHIRIHLSYIHIHIHLSYIDTYIYIYINIYIYIYITCTCWLESLSPAISSSFSSLRGSWTASGRRSEVAETVKSWLRPATNHGECGEYVTLTSIYGNIWQQIGL